MNPSMKEQLEALKPFIITKSKSDKRPIHGKK